MFVHLHVHSNHSHLRGALHVADIVRLAVAHQLPAIAITDRNSVAGAVTFYKQCKSHQIRPLIGTELDDPHTDDRCILLARDQGGYQLICSLISQRHLNPQFSLLAVMAQINEHVVVLTDSEALLPYLYDHPYTYIELVFDSGAIEDAAAAYLINPSRHPYVATNAIYFESASDFELYRILRAIDQNVTLSQLQDSDCEQITREHYFKSVNEMEDLFGDYPDALDATQEIAALCHVELELGTYRFPTLKSGHSDKKLRELCTSGLTARVAQVTEKYHDRLDMELRMIADLQFTDYFLLVWDIVQFAQSAQIPSIGRGSGANSLVSYCLGLTHVDPIEQNLYFERFLNPSRKSPPDMDLDFCWKRRTKVLEYVYQKYGEDRVAMICTTVTLGLRSSFREVGKVLGLDDREISTITKRFPYFTKMVESIEKLKIEYPGCRNLPLEKEPYRTIFYIAQRLAAFPRHLSVHPGGIIITDQPLTDYTPQQRSANGLIVTQYDMYSIEDIGLVKIDLLGNRSLSVYQDTLEMVESQGISRPPTHDLDYVFQDAATQELIRTGRTMGCFYIESPAMRSLLQKLQTTTFEGLTAASSVIRPGVAESGMMDQYIERCLKPAKARYLHPMMETLLAETHGVMIYQEDVLKVAHHLAGMSLADADLFRRAMSGKARSRDAMQRLIDQFLSGCIRNGVTETVAKEIWRQVESFAGYSFCKAHSASYAQLSFQVAYLKQYYPAQFLASVINNGGGFYSVSAYVSEAKRMGIRVLLPSVNSSEIGYTGQDDWIRMGLVQIAEVPIKLKQHIVTERKQGGQYHSLYDFLRRTKISRRNVEILILCGACDCFVQERAALMYTLSMVYDGASLTSQQTSVLFNPEPIIQLPELSGYTKEEIGQYELTYFGFLVSWHPLDFFTDQLTHPFVSAAEMDGYENMQVRMLGWCITAKTIRTRKTKSHMKFMSMEDLTGTYEVTLFPGVYEQFAVFTGSSGPYIVEGEIQNHFGVLSLTASNITLLNFKR